VADDIPMTERELLEKLRRTKSPASGRALPGTLQMPMSLSFMPGPQQS
jgi:hypothetical protein